MMMLFFCTVDIFLIVNIFHIFFFFAEKQKLLKDKNIEKISNNCNFDAMISC